MALSNKKGWHKATLNFVICININRERRDQDQFV